MPNRRKILISMAGLATAAMGGSAWVLASSTSRGKPKFEVVHTEAEWKKILTPARYRVLREEDTEPPFSSPLLKEKRKGLFHCAGCRLAVYSSEAKYNSGTGWPSFYESLPRAVGTRTDYLLVLPRTEVHCRRCGGHFGHIFDDGPPPTGKRHCLNGFALTFEPAEVS